MYKMKIALTLILSFLIAARAEPALINVPNHDSLFEGARIGPANSQIDDEQGAVALDQALKELTSPFTVLCIAARPGDEDDGTLAYVRKKLGARAVILFATRGEGEESYTRPESNLELGVVRTREALEAARVIGADISFLNLRDIGYSKAADELFSVWGHEEALRRMVGAIRSLRPDVIITNHSPKTGEGIDQAIARLAFDAFNEAAGTKLAPEAGSEAWQPRRIFQRTDQPAGAVKIDLKEFDHVRGRTYAQMGLAAHHRFVSRGMTLDQLTPEREVSYYKLLASAPGDALNEDSPGLLAGLALAENLSRSLEPPRLGDAGGPNSTATRDRLIDTLIEKLIERRAEGTAEVMRERHGPEFVRVVRYTAALERSLALAMGLHLEVKVSDNVVVPGQMLSGRIVLRNGGPRPFPVVFSTPERLPISDKNSAYKDSAVVGVGSGGGASQEFEYEIAKDATLTTPRSAHLYDNSYYPVGSTLPGAQPGEPFGSQLLVSADIGLGQVSIRISALARFDIAAPVEIATVPFALARDWATQRDISLPLTVRNRMPGKLAGALWVVPLALADDEYDPVHIAFAREDEEATIRLKLRLPILKPPLTPDVLIEFRREKPAPPDPLGTAKIDVRAAGFEVAAGVKVGYIRGLDNWLSTTFTQLGIENYEQSIDEISVTEHGNATNAQSRIGCVDLAGFDTIVVDRNAYFTRPELSRHNRCLLGYVRQGGNLVVLNQRPDDWNLLLANTPFAPYPLKLSKDRIAIESSAVKILDTEHPLMSKPNKISASDFEGWVVERANSIPHQWATEYTPLLEAGDPGEEPKRGGLLVARYGEGTYVLVSFSLKQQLLAGNAGAYRLFANLTSLPRGAKPKQQ